MTKIHPEDKAEHARLIGGEVIPRKRRSEAPIKICYQCYQLNYRAVRVCCGCFWEFYPSKAKKNETGMASDLPINFGELR